MISIRLLGSLSDNDKVASSRASGSAVVATMPQTRTPAARARYAARPVLRVDILGGHIAVRIKRGGGTGPMKPRQPPARERCQFHQAPTTSLGDVDRRF